MNNEFNNPPAQPQLQPQPQPQPTQQPEAPIILTPHQETMLNALPVGHENAKLVCDIRAGFTIKYGRKLIAFLHTHGIINWVPKGNTARYKKWFRPQSAQIKS